MRAFVHMHSNGHDGASPHVLADVVRKLSLRHNVSVLRVDIDNMAMELVVNGHRVVIHQAGMERGETWFLASLGSCGVRFNPCRTAELPAAFSNGSVTVAAETLLKDGWYGKWPNHRAAPRSYAAFASDVLGEKVEVASMAEHTYLSESAFVDAVNLLMESLRWTPA